MKRANMPLSQNDCICQWTTSGQAIVLATYLAKKQGGTPFTGVPVSHDAENAFKSIQFYGTHKTHFL